MAVLCGVLFLDGMDVSMVGMALPSIDADPAREPLTLSDTTFTFVTDGIEAR